MWCNLCFACGVIFCFRFDAKLFCWSTCFGRGAIFVLVVDCGTIFLLIKVQTLYWLRCNLSFGWLWCNLHLGCDLRCNLCLGYGATYILILFPCAAKKLNNLLCIIIAVPHSLGLWHPVALGLAHNSAAYWSDAENSILDATISGAFWPCSAANHGFHCGLRHLLARGFQAFGHGHHSGRGFSDFSMVVLRHPPFRNLWQTSLSWPVFGVPGKFADLF